MQKLGIKSFNKCPTSPIDNPKESEEDEIIDLYEDIEEYEIKESYITMVDYAERQFR